MMWQGSVPGKCCRNNSPCVLQILQKSYTHDMWGTTSPADWRVWKILGRSGASRNWSQLPRLTVLGQSKCSLANGRTVMGQTSVCLLDTQIILWHVFDMRRLCICRSDEPNNQRDMSLEHRVINTLEELEVIYAITRTACELLIRTYSHTFAHVTGNCEYFRNRNWISQY